jgi:hypothetical protein
MPAARPTRRTAPAPGDGGSRVVRLPGPFEHFYLEEYPRVVKLAYDLAQHTQLRLGKVPGPPGLAAVAGELLAVPGLVVVGVGVPGGPVAPLVRRWLR